MRKYPLVSWGITIRIFWSMLWRHFIGNLGVLSIFAAVILIYGILAHRGRIEMTPIGIVAMFILLLSLAIASLLVSVCAVRQGMRANWVGHRVHVEGGKLSPDGNPISNEVAWAVWWSMGWRAAVYSIGISVVVGFSLGVMGVKLPPHPMVKLLASVLNLLIMIYSVRVALSVPRKSCRIWIETIEPPVETPVS